MKESHNQFYFTTDDEDARCNLGESEVLISQGYWHIENGGTSLSLIKSTEVDYYDFPEIYLVVHNWHHGKETFEFRHKISLSEWLYFSFKTVGEVATNFMDVLKQEEDRDDYDAPTDEVINDVDQYLT
jgi:hypothetical protein